MQVNITTLTDTRVENGPRTSMNQMTLMGGENKYWSEIKFNGAQRSGVTSFASVQTRSVSPCPDYVPYL